MNGLGEAAVTLASEVRRLIDGVEGVEVAVCPPYPSLEGVSKVLAGSTVKLGAQDVFWKDSGAYTGKVSSPMLKAVGCGVVIVGHSECRGRFGKADAEITDETILHFGDTDASVSLKLKAALKHGLDVILCCGEMLAEREAGNTDQIVGVQVQAALHGVSTADLARVTVAYEPVWAIGTGETCDSAEANRVCGVIRGVIAHVAGAAVAEQIRIQYGGSVTADNAAELLSQPEIDGALVGGQSLKPEAFAKIVKAAV